MADVKIPMAKDLAILLYLHYMKHFLGRQDVSYEAASIGSVHVEVTEEIIAKHFAALTASLAQAEAKVEATSVPVSDEEWSHNTGTRGFVEMVLASRAQQQPAKEKETGQ